VDNRAGAVRGGECYQVFEAAQFQHLAIRASPKDIALCWCNLCSPPTAWWPALLAKKRLYRQPADSSSTLHQVPYSCSVILGVALKRCSDVARLKIF
jgi:hypothetical protein